MNNNIIELTKMIINHNFLILQMRVLRPGINAFCSFTYFSTSVWGLILG